LITETTSRPGSAMDHETIRVGIAIVQRGDQVLVGIRDAAAVLGGKHEFPGGKCLDGESPAVCAERECFEETGLRVAAESLLQQVDHTYAHGHLQLFFYLCREKDAVSSTSPNTPAAPFGWVPITQLASLNFPAANQSAVALLERQRRV